MYRYRETSYRQSQSLRSQPSSQSANDWFTQLEEKLNNNPNKHSVNDKCIAIDCEMVGVGYMGNESALARVSIVDYRGEKLLDKYVKPQKEITDYRTRYSGITRKHLENAYDFEEVQREVEELMKDNLIIGQSLGFDFNALGLKCVNTAIRDTSHYYYLFGDRFGNKQMYKNKKPSLRKLAKQVLGLDIQEGTHDSVEDARICMILYRLKQHEWEVIMNEESNMSILTSDIGGCSICGSFNHVRSRCPSNPMRQRMYI